MRSSSVWPGASTLPFWNVSTARKASGPSPPGRQSMPDSQPKKNRTFPLGNALLYIRTANDFFRQGAPFGVRLSFVLRFKPSLPAPPGLLVQFRTGDSPLIQLTEENEKSEPFSYWKKVRILCLWCG